MKLLLVNDEGISGKGGAENRIRSMCQQLLNKKVCEEIHVLKNKESTREDEAIIGVFYHTCAPGIRSVYKKTEEIIKKHGIDIVQLHNTPTLSPASVLAAKKLKKKVVFFAHDYWPVCGQRHYVNPHYSREKKHCDLAKIPACIECVGIRKTLYTKVWKKILNKADIGIATGRYALQSYEAENLLKNKWKVIVPWISLDTFGVTKQERNNHMLFVGSLVDYKGAWVAAESLKYVLQELPETNLLFVGASQEEGPLQSIKQIGVRDNTLDHMKFLGSMNWDKLQMQYATAGVLVLPTDWRGTFGCVWAEAFASGCPVIASNTGAISEYVEGKGILISPRDPEALAREVIRVLKNSSVASQMSKIEKEYAFKTFDIARAVDELQKIYTSLIQ